LLHSTAISRVSGDHHHTLAGHLAIYQGMVLIIVSFLKQMFAIRTTQKCLQDIQQHILLDEESF